MSYLKELNEAQREAVEYTDGASIVLAGAGSGKTRVLTYRIAHLLKKGISPFEVLALTFTNKAAREMKKRIAQMVSDSDARSLWMGTFHSNFAKILRIESDTIGFPSNFSIYDQEDSKRLIKKIVKEMGLDDKSYKPSIVHNRISLAKNNLIGPEDYNSDDLKQSEDIEAKRPMLGQIYSAYQSRLFHASAMDFDDLLFNTYTLLCKNLKALHKYQGRFRYILVDEFQDTNYCQYLILRKLAARYQNICVVGDDAQSIYAFRGAHIRNMQDFQKDYPDTKVFKLEQNYRSTKNIVAVANCVIEKNKQQLHKTVWTANDEGARIQVHRLLTDNEEGFSVANQIFQIKNNHQVPNNHFALLYRTNAQSRALEEALRKINIPYRVYGGLSFYQRREVKDLLAYFRLTFNHNDEEAFRRIINYPARGIGQTTLEKLTVTAHENICSLWDVATNCQAFQLNINSGTKTKLSDFVNMIKSFAIFAEENNAFDTASHIAVSSGIIKELKNDESIEGQSRLDNIQELLNAIQSFVDQPLPEDRQQWSLEDFLLEVALLTDMDKEDKDKTERVSLMTIHSAKGLEFPYVFITGMEESLFPSHMAIHDRADLEEERRLFYVAVTRAMKKVILTYAATRYKWGELYDCEPSRFLDEINPDYLQFSHTESKRKPQFNSRKQTATREVASLRTGNRRLINLKEAGKSISVDNSYFIADDIKDIQVGMHVEHQRFGKGKVLNIEGEMPNRKATIFFKLSGQKQLLLKFARLKISS